MRTLTKRRLERPLAVFMAALLAIGLFPAVAVAATHSFDISLGDILIEESTAYPGALSVSVDGTITQDNIDRSDTIQLTGSTSENSVTVDVDGNVNLELSNLSIVAAPGPAFSRTAINITGAANVAMSLAGANTLDSGSNISSNAASIRLGSDATLTIDGTSSDSLQVTGVGSGPGIGANFRETAGSLIINGGTITAQSTTSAIAGGSEGCAIGGGYQGSMKSIVINGGTITAKAAKCAAIGANYTEINGGVISGTNNPSVSFFTNPVIGVNNGTTVITGGTITADGSGNNLGGSTIRITGGSVTAVQGTFQTQPTNGAVPVYASVFNTGSATTAVQPGDLDAQRTGLTTALVPDPYGNVYGVAGVVSDASADVCFWLPEIDIPVIDVADHSAVLGYDDSGLPRTIAAGLDNPADLALLNPSDFSAAATYQWLKDGTPITGATSPTLQATEKGDYTLEVTDTSAESGSPVTYESQRTITLTAQYTIDFDKNGGFGYDHSQTKLVDTPLTLDANGYTLTGYTFIGWNTAANGSGTSYADGAVLSTDLSTTAGSTVTLYAQWAPIQYWVQFVGNGSDTGTMVNQQLTYDASTQTLTANAYGRTGYTFAGWNAAADGSGTSYADQAIVSPDLTSTAGAIVSLFAQWTANNYTVVYDGNGSDAGSMGNQGFTYDANQSLAQNAFSRTGYTFTGWNTAADGTGQSFADQAAKPNASADPNGTVTLYAQWVANEYDIAFNGNGSDSGSMNPIPTVWDATVTVPAPVSAFARTGYLFEGWNTEANGSGTWFWIGDDLRNISPGDTGATVVLYAQWQASTYDVTFDGNGADSGSMTDQTLTYDTAATLDLNAFMRAGYTFTGWSWAAPDGTERTFADGELVQNLVTDGSTVDLVAQWQANSYAVSFDGNGATAGAMIDQPMTYDVEAGLTANAYKRGGHDFAGWNTEADGSGTAYTDGQAVKNLTPEQNGSVTLYAQWTEHAPVIAVDAASYKHGETVTVSGSGFEPGVLVKMTLHSTPIHVATLTSQADGTLAGTFTVPTEAEVGSHTLQADDSYHTALVQLEIAKAASPSDDPSNNTTPSNNATGDGAAKVLPHAGDTLLPFALGALGLLVIAGGVLVVVRRHQRS